MLSLLGPCGTLGDRERIVAEYDPLCSEWGRFFRGHSVHCTFEGRLVDIAATPPSGDSCGGDDLNNE